MCVMEYQSICRTLDLLCKSTVVLNVHLIKQQCVLLSVNVKAQWDYLNCIFQWMDCAVSITSHILKHQGWI